MKSSFETHTLWTENDAWKYAENNPFRIEMHQFSEWCAHRAAPVVPRLHIASHTLQKQGDRLSPALSPWMQFKNPESHTSRRSNWISRLLCRKTWIVWWLKRSVVSNVWKSYSPSGIDGGIDLVGSALFKGKRLINCKAIVNVVIELWFLREKLDNCCDTIVMCHMHSYNRDLNIQTLST